VNRRSDDPQPEVDERDVVKFLADLEDGRKSNRRLAKAVAWGVLIIALAAVVVGLVLDRAQDDIRDNAAALEQSQRDDRVRAEKICEDLTDNARRFNSLIDTLILRTRKSPTIPPAQKAEAVRLYTSAKQTLPVCVPPLEGR
jgi:hypothetical protein